MIDALSILRHYFQARRPLPFANRVDLERWQQERFDRFAQRVLARSPYYRRFAGKRLGDYPIVNKAAMMESFDLINTAGLRKNELMEIARRSETTRDFSTMLGQYSVGLSSGTSGLRGLFVISRAERLQYAATVLAKGLSGNIFSHHKIALLLRANNQLYEQVNFGAIRFRYFDLSKDWQCVLTDIQQYGPDVIVAAPQILCLLAQAQAGGRVYLAPRQLIAGAEVLDTLDSEMIESVFHTAVHQIYQATEGFLGISCDKGIVHLNEEYIIFEKEWVDRSSGRFIPIITDFTRSTQPIVRYRLDDVLVESAQLCPCGNLCTSIRMIEGRADDILFLPKSSDGSLAPVMPDFLRDAIAARHDLVKDYRIIQTAPTEIEISCDGPSKAAAQQAIIDALASIFNRFGLDRPSFRSGLPIENNFMLKRRRVQRRFPLPEAAWNVS